MLLIRPMNETEFQNFLPDSIAGYAADKVRSGNWTLEEAERRSTEEHARLLPQGLATPQ